MNFRPINIVSTLLTALYLAMYWELLLHSA
jgi:hypothetical protein